MPRCPTGRCGSTSVDVEGVTAYPQPEIAQLADGLVGPAVPLPQIDAARQAILQRYRADGYVLTTVVGRTSTHNGRLRFVVTEGRIASVKLDGDIGPAGTQVLRFLNRLTEKQPIDSVTLERYLLLAQDVPGVTPARRAGAIDRSARRAEPDRPGQPPDGVRPRHASTTAPSTRPGRSSSSACSTSTASPSSARRPRSRYYHAFPNSQNFGQVSTETFLGASGLKGKVYGGYGVTVPTGSLGQQGYSGTTTVFGAQLSYPVIRSRQQTLNVYARVRRARIRHIASTANGTPRTQASYDALRVLRLGEDYALSDLWLGADRSAVNALSVRMSQGMKLLGASTDGNRDVAAAGRADRISSRSTSRRAARRRCSRRGKAPASA